MFTVLIFTLSTFVVQDVHAVTFVGSQSGPGQWTYYLTYQPFDNFAVCHPSATITLTNLVGVTSASKPVLTDLNALGALDWIPTVSNGGTKVVWTHVGPGTGNYNVDKHVFGFRVFSPAIDGTVSVSTNGFEGDVGQTSCPGQDRDIVATTSGPAVPVPEKSKFVDCKNIKNKESTICRDFKYKPGKISLDNAASTKKVLNANKKSSP